MFILTPILLLPLFKSAFNSNPSFLITLGYFSVWCPLPFALLIDTQTTANEIPQGQEQLYFLSKLITVQIASFKASLKTNLSRFPAIWSMVPIAVIKNSAENSCIALVSRTVPYETPSRQSILKSYAAWRSATSALQVAVLILQALKTWWSLKQRSAEISRYCCFSVVIQV